jgi:protein-S-isoprenylcysteine O-methyltransferase Ste14
MIKSWKTTAAGILAILTALGVAFSQYLSGGFAAVQWEVLITAVLAGIGLIAAKDAGVSNAPNPGPAVKVVSPGA